MRKSKIITSMSAGLIASTSLLGATASLTSCSGNGSSKILDDYIQLDNENGFDQKWFDSFVVSYKNQVVSQAIEPLSISDEAKTQKIKTLDNSIQTFKTKLSVLLNDENSKKFAYTAISNAMIELGQQLYSYNGQPIRITRSCNVTLNDVQTMFNNMSQSCEISMANAGLDREYIDKTLEQSKQLCEKKLSSLCEAYADPALIMSKARQALPQLFAGANEQIGLLGAQQALSDFAENFNVEYNLEKGARFDELVGNDGKPAEAYDEDGKLVKFEVGNDISAFINNIFTITNNKTGRKVDFNKTELIPGFILKPTLSTIKQNPLGNDYGFGIDWQCMSSCYATVKDAQKKRVTAHLSNNVKDDDALRANMLNVKPDQNFLNDIFSNDEVMEPTPIDYAIPLTVEEEKNRLRDYYFEGTKTLEDYDDFVGRISFEFDKSENCCLDPFISAPKYKDSDTNDNDNVVTLGLNDLARAGLKLRLKSTDGQNEDKVIRVDKIIAVNEWDDKKEDLKLSETEKLGDIDFKLRQLIKNCIITSKCKITEDSNGTNVECELYAAYKNYNGLSNKDLINDHAIKVGTASQTSLPISPYAYWQLTNKYNQIWAFVNEKIDFSKYEKAYDASINSLINMAVMSSVEAVLLGASLLLMIYGPAQLQSKVAIAIWGGFCIFDTIILALQFTHTLKHRLLPFKGFYERSIEFKNSGVVQTTLRCLEEDANDAHVIKATKNNENAWILSKKLYDDAFDQNYKDSSGVKYSILRKYNEKFGNILSYENMNEFLKKQSELELLDSDYERYQSQWEEGGVHYKINKVLGTIAYASMWTQIALSLIEIVISIFQAVKNTFFKATEESLSEIDEIAENMSEFDSSEVIEDIERQEVNRSSSLQTTEKNVMSSVDSHNESLSSVYNPHPASKSEVREIYEEIDKNTLKGSAGDFYLNNEDVKWGPRVPFIGRGQYAKDVPSVTDVTLSVEQIENPFLPETAKQHFIEHFPIKVKDNIIKMVDNNAMWRLPKVNGLQLKNLLIKNSQSIERCQQLYGSANLENIINTWKGSATTSILKWSQLAKEWKSMVAQSIKEALADAINVSRGIKILKVA